MVNIYDIKNNELNTKAEFSESVLIDSMKLAKFRNKKLYIALIDIWEQLNKKTFDEDREFKY